MIKLDFGIRDYDEILSLQKHFVNSLSVGNTNRDFFLIGEHYPVVTLGIRPEQEKNLKVTTDKIYSENIKVRKIHRGGFATYHGPGQIVGYPIFNLRKNDLGIKQFIDKIQDVLILALRSFGIMASKKDRFIGVWVEDNKIASIGVGVNKGISYHGFALNVNNNLEKFDYIIPCGLDNIKMVSIREIKGHEVSLDKVKKACINCVMKIFKKSKVKKYKGDDIF